MDIDGTRRPAMILGACLSLLGCARREDARIAPVHETKADAPAESQLPFVRKQSDVEAHHGHRVTVLGVYEVEPVHAYKKGGRMTTIVLADGTRVYRSYDLVKSEIAFASRRVRVTGTITRGAPDPTVQSVNGPHVAAERIELQEGEAPTTPVPTRLPTPPMVNSIAGFAPHADRWVAVNGVVDSTLSTAGGSGDVILELSDGGLVSASAIQVHDWKPLLGKGVTTIARAHFEGTGAAIGMRVELHGAGAPCPGVEPRCGMDEP